MSYDELRDHQDRPSTAPLAIVTINREAALNALSSDGDRAS